MPKHDTQSALFSTILRRVHRRFPSLLNLLGIVMVISGIVGLLFLQSPLNKTTDDRSGATSPSGPATTVFEPASGSTIVYNGATQAPVLVDFKLNTQGFQVIALQYVFNIVSPILAESPQVYLPPSSALKIDQSEVQQVGDGYLVSVTLVPANDGDTFSSTQDQTILSVSVKPGDIGTISINFDQDFSFAALDDGSAIVDGLKTLPVVNYDVSTGGTPTPTPTLTPSPTPTLAPSPSPDASPTIVPTPEVSPDASPAISPSPSIVPPVSPSPTPTPSPSPTADPVAIMPVNWQTESVSLQADGFYVRANGAYFTPTGAVSVQSDPPSNPLDGYTTLEVIWNEAGKEMRLFMYIYKDATKWTVEEMRIYNGNVPGDWIFFTNPVIASGPHAGQKFSAPLGASFTDSDTVTLTSSENGIGQITFNNISMKAFLPTDDFFFGNAPAWQATFTDSNGQTVLPTQLVQGQTYKAALQFNVNNTHKFSTNNPAAVVTRVAATGQTTAQKDVPILYGLIAYGANGSVGTASDLSFVAGANNSIAAYIDIDAAYPETNEANNYYILSWAAQGTGGTAAKQCNDTCASNEQCPVNQRCYDTGTGVSRCRLVTNVTSEGCQPPAAGSVSCNNACTYSSECASGLSCVDNLCRNPLNAGSTSCAAPSAAQAAAINQSCNQACSSNANCAANLTCYYGVCRLVANPSSSSCSAPTSSTVSTTYNPLGSTTPKGGDLTDDSTPTPTPDASGMLQPVVQSPPPDWSGPKTRTTITETESKQTWLEQIRELLGETGKLATIVIGAGIGLLLISLLWILLSGRKKKGPPTGPSTVKENVVVGGKPMTGIPVGAPGSSGARSAGTPPGPASLAPASGKPPITIAPAVPKVGSASSAVVPHITANPEVKSAGIQPITPLDPALKTPKVPTTAASTNGNSSMLDRIKEKGITPPTQS